MDVTGVKQEVSIHKKKSTHSEKEIFKNQSLE